MKFTAAVAALAVSVNAFDEITRIQSSSAGTVSTKSYVPSTSECNAMPLDAATLIARYDLNISDPAHVAALADAVTGRMSIGSNTQLIPEANDAARTDALMIDGLSGDISFPHGMLKPLATVGEINMCEENHGDVMTGVPDGIGAYLLDDNTVRIVFQSESYGPLMYESWAYSVNSGAASFTGSHVHTIDFDRAGLADFLTHDGPASEILMGFGEASTTYYNLAGDLVGARNADGATTTGAHYSNTDASGNYVVAATPSEADWLMQSLCSAHLEEAHQWGSGMGFEDDIYITNEEWMTYADDSEFVGISMHAMDLANGVDYAVGAVTNSGFEKIIELNPQSTDYVVLAVSGYNGDMDGHDAELAARNAEYGARPDGADYVWPQNIVPSRIYVGMKGKMEDGSDASDDDFLARNGLRYGKMYGFAVDMSEDGPTEGLFRDAFHKPRANGAMVEGKFVAIDWQWDGVVKNFRHDGAWEFQKPVPGYEDTDMKFWNANGYDSSGYKTEHVSPDTRAGITGFVQGSTAGYFGHFYVHGVAEALADSSNGIPAEFDATYYVYQGEQDIREQVILGGAGLYANVEACAGADDASYNCDGSVKNTFEDVDGLEIIAAKEGLFAIIQEDSGNRLGERMFITKLEHEGTELDYYFMAMAGGAYNTRMNAEVGIPADANHGAGSHEFSGIVDLSGMLVGASSRRTRQLKAGGMEEDNTKKAKATKATKAGYSGGAISAGNGYAKRLAEHTVSICDKTIVVNLQAHNMAYGPIKAFKADRGGQVMAYKPDICESMRL
eukprot:Nitzschia sp. Nitz4//scaffold17_size182527//93321//96006//NITZ4_001857-RA/size182527-snap-gene-0.297-mRNA-1//-1//CDS//3329539349//1248//frame0